MLLLPLPRWAGLAVQVWQMSSNIHEDPEWTPRAF